MENFRENIQSLAKAIAAGDDEFKQEDMEFFVERLNMFVNYFNVVYDYVVSEEVNRALYDMDRISREDLIFRLENKDQKRRLVHETAISACAQINRLCDMYHVPQFCPVTQDRYEIAEFIGQFTHDIYQSNISLTKYRQNVMDEVVNIAKERFVDSNRGYDTNVIKEIVNEKVR